MVVCSRCSLATLAVSAYAFRVERDDADRRERDVARQAAVATDLPARPGNFRPSRGARARRRARLRRPRRLRRLRRRARRSSRARRRFPRPAGARPTSGPVRGRDRPEDSRPLARRASSSRAKPPGPLRRRAGRPARLVARQAAGGGPALGAGTPEAIEMALTTGGATLTGPVRLAGSRETGFLADRAALSAAYEPVATPEQRRRALAGFVAAGYGGRRVPARNSRAASRRGRGPDHGRRARGGGPSRAARGRDAPPRSRRGAHLDHRDGRPAGSRARTTARRAGGRARADGLVAMLFAQASSPRAARSRPRGFASSRRAAEPRPCRR